MPISLRSLLLITTIALFGAGPALAGEADIDATIRNVLGGDPAQYKTVFDALQTAVKSHDAAGVAALVSYPISVQVSGKKTSVKSAQSFAEHYDGIMTPDITKAISDQAYGDVFVRDQGMMLGNGEVWISGICVDKACKTQDVKVITIQHAPN